MGGDFASRLRDYAHVMEVLQAAMGLVDRQLVHPVPRGTRVIVVTTALLPQGALAAHHAATTGLALVPPTSGALAMMDGSVRRVRFGNVLMDVRGSTKPRQKTRHMHSQNAATGANVIVQMGNAVV